MTVFCTREFRFEANSRRSRYSIVFSPLRSIEMPNFINKINIIQNPKVMLLLSKIFLIGIMLQFLVQTFVDYRLWITSLDMIWLWKELFFVVLALFVGAYIVWTWNRKFIFQNQTIKILQIVLVVSILISFLCSYFVHWQSIWIYLMAFKYDFFGFVIFFLAFHISALQDDKFRFKLLNFYISVIKFALIAGLVRWVIIWIKPWTLSVLFGYSRDAIEWVVGQAPPAVYRTKERYGYVRNQFLFERPIYFGFWLVAFWPLFYIIVLKNKKLSDCYGRWFLYLLNIILTFSRASRASWIAITGIMFRLEYRHKITKTLIIGLIIFFVIWWLGLYKGKDYIIDREYSNNGHIESLIKWWKMFTSSPMFGVGAGSAGPVSYQLEDNSKAFNPENQYIQILDEFGIIWWIWRFVLFFWFMIWNYSSFKHIYYGSDKIQKIKSDWVKYIFDYHWIVLALSLGMIGLWISGLVLHSFVDRMVVYPFMLVYGILIAKPYTIGKSKDY